MLEGEIGRRADRDRVGPHQISPCGHALCGPCGVTWLESRVSHCSPSPLSLAPQVSHTRCCSSCARLIRMIHAYSAQASAGETVNCPTCREDVNPAQPLIPARNLESMIKKYVESRGSRWDGLTDWKDREE